MEELSTDTKQCSRCKKNKRLDCFKLECKLCNTCLEIKKLYRQKNIRKKYIKNKENIITKTEKLFLTSRKNTKLKTEKKFYNRKKNTGNETRTKSKKRENFITLKNRETILEKQRQKLTMKKELSLDEMD